jgi:predicted nucleic-acid-binding Zn-ribbon protein
LEGRAFKCRFQKASEEKIPINKKKKIKDISRNTFRLFLETFTAERNE